MRNQTNLLLALLWLFSAVCMPWAINAQTPDFKPGGKITGLAFGDYAYKLHADSLKRGNTQYAGLDKHFNGFDIRRIYLGYTYDIAPKFTAELVLAHETGNTLADANRAMYVKFANLRWKGIFNGTDLILGQQRTPTFATPNGSEQIWGYRSIEKTLLDMRKESSATDLGIGLAGKYMDGKLGYDLVFGNNNGAKFYTGGQKKVYGDIYYKFLDKKLEVQLYGDYLDTTSATVKLFAAYSVPAFTVGAEAFSLFKTTTSVINEPVGISVFARGSLITDSAKAAILSAFARFDSWDPNYTQNAAAVTYKTPSKEMFATIGLDYMPAKNVHIMPNLWYNGYKNKLGTTGKIVNNSDYDLVARLTASYSF